MSQLARYFDAGADAYLRLTDRLWGPIGASTARLARAAPGERVLDACCGAGACALPLARDVGPAGHIDAVDLATALVRHGQHQAGAAGLDNISFHVADALTWHRHAVSYDRVVCVLGVFFFPDPTAGTHDLLRCLVPGGCVTLTTWAAGAVQPLGRLLWDALVAEDPARFGVAPASPAAPFETPELLHRWAQALPLAGVEITATPLTTELDADLTWDLVTGTAFAALLDGLPPAGRDRVRSRIGHGMARAGWQIDAGTLTLSGTVTAQQPPAQQVPTAAG